jgi:microsomal epoxide hydrolase
LQRKAIDASGWQVDMEMQPFTVKVSDDALDDLRERLARTRWTTSLDDGDWTHGVSRSYLEALTTYWRTAYDWRTEEAALNRLAQFKVDVDGIGIHFIHEPGAGPRPMPLILTHGYPDSFVRFLKVIPLLTDPAAHGGDADDAFDVIVPSLPGYAFSDPPPRSGLIFQTGALWHSLMTKVLGYERFAAHGGDWGSTVTEQIARSYPSAVVGIHLTDVPFWHLFQKPDHPSRAEEKFLAATDKWQKDEGAYAYIQGTRPYTLASGLADSPTGLAAWIVDKFRAWSDCGGDVESRFTKDELLTNLTIYWATGTIGSAFLPYYDFMNGGPLTWMAEAVKQWTGSKSVPTAIARFPKDISDPPREWAERFFNVERWTEMPRGGHFAAMEEPELLVEDIRAFFRPFRAAGHWRGSGTPVAARS